MPLNPKYMPSPERIEEMVIIFKKKQLAHKKNSQGPSGLRFSDVTPVKCKDLMINPDYFTGSI
jgi:hypothetical protein